jgi:DUF4097 and DUF4098 domain-containing protein YvlB
MGPEILQGALALEKILKRIHPIKELPMNRKWLIAGILILAEILLCAGIVFVSWSGVNQLKVSSVNIRLFSRDLVSAKEDQEWHFNVDGPADLALVSDAGDVEIIAVEGDKISVVAHKTAWGASQEQAQAELSGMNISVTQEGDTVRVVYEIETPSLVIAESRKDKVDFSIRVPVETQVDARTTPGDISLTGVRGDASLEAQFGDLSIIDVEGALKATTNSGEITALRIQGGESSLILSADFGDIRLEDSSAGDLDVRSNSGTLKLLNVSTGGKAYLKSDFGEVDFEQGRASELSVESNSGKITLAGLDLDGPLTARSDFGGLDVQDVQASAYDLQSNSGEIALRGASGAIKAHSDFGSLLIKDVENASLDLETNGGNIEFSGSLGDGPHTLKAKFGNIRLLLPADSALSVDLQDEFGQIKSDFQLTLSGEINPKHWIGAINGGGPTLKASTNSGNISLEIQAQ